jgi:hypothetical protein
MPHSAIFKELSYVFIAAILGGVLAWRRSVPALDTSLALITT